MKKNKLAPLGFLLGLSLYASSSWAVIHPHGDNRSSTPLGPTLKGRYSSRLTQDTAYSLLGEAGYRQARIGGTVGWQFRLNQRLKFSAEYLWQQITYTFFTDDTQQWVDQGAIGLSYEYLFLNECFDPSFILDGYFSRAPSKSLTTQRGTFINKFGDEFSFVDQRRIAGSNAIGLAPGISIAPWLGGRLGLQLNYDYVSYNKNYASFEDANGLGTTIRLTQALSEYIFVGVSGAFQKPFNHYTANIAWISIPYYGGFWTLGFDAAYTAGKERLYSSWDVGLNLEYFLEPYPLLLPVNLNTDCNCKALPMPCNDHLLAWTAKPGVYLPQVLAVEDERLTKNRV